MITRIALATLALLASLAPSSPAAAQARATTGAPYFEAFADGKRVEALPLAMTRVDVVVAGVIADVRLTQVYENRGQVPVEAVYVFPASSRATVHGLTMKVGNRIVRARLRGKAAARAQYEAAKQEGKTATLLEQQDVGAFRMNLANVLPGDRIEVELSYTELLLPTAGVYEFFFPNTAPEEHYRKEGDPDTTMPRSGAPAVTQDAITITTRILSAAPIASIDSPSHKLKIARTGDSEALVTLDPAESDASRRDFVLRYSMLGDDIGTGVLAHPGADENFFLLTAQPPRNVGMDRVPPREYVFVLDVSGSMNGQPMDVSKQLMRELFAGLRQGDRFNVVLFAGDSAVLSPGGSLPADAEGLQRAIKLIDGTDAGGGTELAAALEKAYALPRTPGMARAMVVVTDGAISAGGDVSKLISSKLDQASVFVFGIGQGVDHATIARLARAGEGEAFDVMEMGKADAEARRLRAYIERPVLTNVRLEVIGADLYDLEPPSIPDLYAQRPIVIVGKYRGPLAGHVRIHGISGAHPVTLEVDLAKAYVDPSLDALPRLWARRRVDRITDAACPQWGSCNSDNPERDKAIEDIGLRYGILTSATSFVAVTEEVRTTQEGVTVAQPVAAREHEDEADVMAPGFDAGLATLALASASRALVLPAADAAAAPRLVAGHWFVSGPDGWRDLAHKDGARLLRIRRDSAAYLALLRLAPELADALALEGRVLVSFGGWSILVTPDGFSDYPEATLQRALGRRG
jgi:Ca-activated chloride channel family protein